MSDKPDYLHDTIVAAATPAGVGGIGIVRISGAAVPQIAGKMLGGLPPPRVASLREFHDAADEPIDTGLALYFPAPGSFTGEPVLELHGHGGPVVMALLVDAADAGRCGRRDDRQQLSQAMMELYKREKVNPAAGCLPILIQMPFFLAFYWVLLESVEMRQAPFALWITDLSSRDPYFILPLIMGVAMLLQTKLNPAPADPVQAKVMQIMPIMFTGFFAFFPSGLVLYWVTNTILSIAQQWRINKIVEEESKKGKGKAKAKPKA